MQQVCHVLDSDNIYFDYTVRNGENCVPAVCIESITAANTNPRFNPNLKINPQIILQGMGH